MGTVKFKVTDRFNDEEREAWGQLTSDEGRRLFMQYFFKRDFYSLLFLLGYQGFAKFHDEAIERLGKIRKIKQDDVIQNLWLWSRGFFKTTIITEAHTIFLIVNNPNIRILLRSNTITIAETMLKNIKGHFVSNENFRFFFKEFCPKENSVGNIEFGTTTEFTIPTRNKILKEPTVMASGIGTNLTGLHFDYQKIDDQVTKDSVTNDDQILASKDDYYSLRHLYDKPSCPKEDVVGTIYHFNDLYSEMKKKTSHKISFVPATSDGTLHGEAVFPERLTVDQLLKIFDDLGPYQGSTQYLLNPINPADAKFKSEWLKEYDFLPTGCSEYICVDPASTTKKKSDYTVIQRWGRGYQGHDYLIEGIRDKLTVFQRMDKIVEMARRCTRLAKVKYEAIGGRHGDLETLQKRFMDENIAIIPQETKGAVSSKKDRIEQRLVPRFHGGLIFLPRNLIYRSEYDGKIYDFVALYKTEYLQHPMNEHDDILDCHTQMYEEPFMMESGRRPTDGSVEKRKATADDEEKFYQMQRRMSAINPFLTSEQIKNKIRTKQIKRMLQRV